MNLSLAGQAVGVTRVKQVGGNEKRGSRGKAPRKSFGATPCTLA